MVPDLHQIMLKGGGLFSYPGTSDKPHGKLRQLFEVTKADACSSSSPPIRMTHHPAFLAPNMR